MSTRYLATTTVAPCATCPNFNLFATRSDGSGDLGYAELTTEASTGEQVIRAYNVITTGAATFNFAGGPGGALHGSMGVGDSIAHRHASDTTNTMRFAQAVENGNPAILGTFDVDNNLLGTSFSTNGRAIEGSFYACGITSVLPGRRDLLAKRDTSDAIRFVPLGGTIPAGCELFDLRGSCAAPVLQPPVTCSTKRGEGDEGTDECVWD